tara:strand:+ start:23844 stop:26072 length:2229 start_codon:yes stop_codon:yes gene_type:complete
MPDLMTALRNADAAGDTEAANRIAVMIKEQQNTLPMTVTDKPLQQQVEKSALAPRMRQQRTVTPDLPSEAVETMGSPELHESGILFGQEGGAALTPALLTATDPNEIAEIISSNYPDIATQYQKAPDGSVYPVLTNRKTGATSVINRPGLSALDVMQGVGLLAAYTPAGRASTALSSGLKAGATGASIEATQSVSGGEFDPLTPVLDVAFGGMGHKAVELIKNARSATGRNAPVAKGRLKEFVSKNFKSARYTPPQKEQAVDDIVKAAMKGDESKLASIIDVDPEFLAAKESLGLTEQGLPSAASRNRIYQETEQALKKMPGSPLSDLESKAVIELQQKADDLIDQFGGTTKKAQLSEDLASSATKAIDDLSLKAEDAYKGLSENINPKTPVNTQNISDVITDELENVGGRVSELTPLEKTMNNLIEGDVTYRAIDRRRKQVGEAMSGKGGPFKDAGKAELSKWYSLLTEAQEAAAPQFADQWTAAKQLVSQRKALEDNAIKSFGKELNEAFMPKLGAAVKQLSKGDYKKFDTLVNSLPPSQRKRAVTSALNDAFTQGSRKEQQLSVAGFADWFNALNRDKQLRGRIFKNIEPELRGKLISLGKVTNGIRNAQATAPIGGQVLAGKGVMDKIVDGIGSKFLAKLPGFIGGIVESGLKKSNTKAFDNAISLLGDPEFVKNIKFLAGNQAQKAEQKIMSSNAFKKWISTLAEDEVKAVNTVGFREYLLSDEEQANTEAPQEITY